jgi:hypothetical protein
MEGKKSHEKLPESWRTTEAGSMTQFMKTAGKLMVQHLVCAKGVRSWCGVSCSCMSLSLSAGEPCFLMSKVRKRRRSQLRRRG